MTPEVEQAIDEIRVACPDVAVILREDDAGGAFVILESVDPGERYLQRETWIGFHITYQYPNADVYPHFVRRDLARADGRPLGDGMSAGCFERRDAIQISRRSNRLDPKVDTAALKLAKVLEWLVNHE